MWISYIIWYTALTFEVEDLKMCLCLFIDWTTFCITLVSRQKKCVISCAPHRKFTYTPIYQKHHNNNKHIQTYIAKTILHGCVADKNLFSRVSSIILCIFIYFPLYCCCWIFIFFFCSKFISFVCFTALFVQLWYLFSCLLCRSQFCALFLSSFICTIFSAFCFGIHLNMHCLQW